MKNEIQKGLLVGFAGAGVLALALAASPALAADPAPSTDMGGALKTAEKTELTHASATVSAIDKSGRKVTIKAQDGTKTVIKVPTDMKEFDKLKVGDKIEIDYMESIALSMLPPGTKPSVTERTATAPGAAGRELSVSAEIVSIDAANNKVTLKGPKGRQMTVNVSDPDLQARVANMKPGQVVQLSYTEAVATAIQPPAK
jgi:Cu/Ag efflux protein CusF